MGYTGTTWQDKAKTIAKNVHTIVQDSLIMKNKDGTYHLQEVPSSSDVVNFNKPRPYQDANSFKLTCPRANGDLPIREREYAEKLERFSQHPELLKEFTAGVQKHNSAVNKGGCTFKGDKRVHDDLDTTPATAVTAKQLTPVQVSKEDIGGPSIEHPSKDYDLIFAPDASSMYLNAKRDATVETSADWGTITGVFRTGSAAEASIQLGFNWEGKRETEGRGK